MVCVNYSELTPREKVLFIGELTHACMSDDSLFEMGVALIQIAKTKGLFENVKINPPTQNDTKN